MPLGTLRSNLAVPKREGYVRRWVNDVGGRLRQAEDGGYTFVDDPDLKVGERDSANPDGARQTYIVGRNDNGSSLKAYLMEIRKEWYDEDQAAKMDAVDEIDNLIQNGGLGNDEQREGQYVPDEGISITRGR